VLLTFFAIVVDALQDLKSSELEYIFQKDQLYWFQILGSEVGSQNTIVNSQANDGRSSVLPDAQSKRSLHSPKTFLISTNGQLYASRI
jgi:hypothetical protein